MPCRAKRKTSPMSWRNTDTEERMVQKTSGVEKGGGNRYVTGLFIASDQQETKE